MRFKPSYWDCTFTLGLWVCDVWRSQLYFVCVIFLLLSSINPLHLVAICLCLCFRLILVSSQCVSFPHELNFAVRENSRLLYLLACWEIHGSGSRPFIRFQELHYLRLGCLVLIGSGREGFICATAMVRFWSHRDDVWGLRHVSVSLCTTSQGASFKHEWLDQAFAYCKMHGLEE